MNIRKAMGISPNEKIWEITSTKNDFCPCQICGHPSGECMCEKNKKIEICEYVEKLQAENKKLIVLEHKAKCFVFAFNNALLHRMTVGTANALECLIEELKQELVSE